VWRYNNYRGPYPDYYIQQVSKMLWDGEVRRLEELCLELCLELGIRKVLHEKHLKS